MRRSTGSCSWLVRWGGGNPTKGTIERQCIAGRAGPKSIQAQTRKRRGGSCALLCQRNHEEQNEGQQTTKFISRKVCTAGCAGMGGRFLRSAASSGRPYGCMPALPGSSGVCYCDGSRRARLSLRCKSDLHFCFELRCLALTHGFASWLCANLWFFNSERHSQVCKQPQGTLWAPNRVAHDLGASGSCI